MIQIYINFIPYRVRIVFCFLLVCLIGCTPLSNDSTVVSQLAVTAPTATATAQPHTAPTATIQPQVSIPAPQPRPDFVRQVSPLESATVPLSLFESPGEDRSIPTDDIPSGFPDPTQGYNSQVCVRINLTTLVQPKDDLSGYDKIMPHVTFIMDAHELEDPAFYYFLTDLEPEIIVADDGSMQWIGPFTLCWATQLFVGAHQATIQFEQTSGDVQSYSWHFIIVDG
jgi:hypothetical protein